MRRYPYAAVDLAAPHGKTAELLDTLLQLRKKGVTEGAEEIVAVLEELARGVGEFRFEHYLTEGSPARVLCREFLNALRPARMIDDPFFARIAQAISRDELPLCATPVANASSGLLACLMAADVAGGEVIVPSLNYPGMPNVLLMAGAIPRFADVRADDWQLDLSSVEPLLGEQTRAIVFVHMNQFCDLEPLHTLLQQRGFDIPVIQDASVAIGSTRHGVPVGAINLGPKGATVFSFATTKVLTGLGGGIVVSNSSALCNEVYSMSYMGLNLASDLCEVTSIGGNFRMSDLNAAIVRAQLRRRATLFARRRTLRTLYETALAPLVAAGRLILQQVDAEGILSHLAVCLPERSRIVPLLNARYGIECGSWTAHHTQPLFREYAPADPLPVTERLAQEMVFLPFHTRLTDEDVTYIAEALTTVLG